MYCSPAKLLVPLFLLTVFYRTSKALDGHQKCSSFCGDHNVRRPLRLKDYPEECGDHKYNLYCEQNQLVMYLQSGRYSVLSINYEHHTIRVRDANIVKSDTSSLPGYSLTDYNFSSQDYPRAYYPSWYVENKYMIYVRCEQPVDSAAFVDTAPCFNTPSNASVSSSSSNFYANVGSIYVEDLDLKEDCRIEMMYMTSWPDLKKNQNQSAWSCTDIHNMLLYGFDLYWPEGKDSIFEEILQVLENPLTYVSGLLLLVLYTGAKFVLGAPFVIALLIYKWRRRHLSMYESIEEFLQSDINSIMPIRYSYREIKKMTKGFNVRLGKGGFGSVFKGQLRSGRDVAVKMLDKAEANGQDFINEVATLGRIHHGNVVHLIGYCVEGSKRSLIYEFMQNGSLDKYILSKHVDDKESLNLHQLYTISLGVARGIEYLHKGCDMQILHFDIKPHNILLDDNFNPKVSDFGLAKLYPTNDSIVSLTAARGTIGYMAPELFYKNVGGVSYKADVYSFGMLLMEIAGRRKNLNVLAEQSSQFYFPFWAYDQLNEGNEISVADATEEERKVARKMMIVALWCIQTKPSDRPSMNKVVEMLEGDDEDLELPQKPYLYPQDLPESADNHSHSSTTQLYKSNSHPSMNKAVEMFEEEEQELVLLQKPSLYTQDPPTIDVNDHLCSTPPSSSDPLMNNVKETTSFLTREDERSI